MICNSERIMKGPVLLFNIKIDFLVSLKCLSSDTGNNMKLNYQGSSLINQTKNAAGKKANCPIKQLKTIDFSTFLVRLQKKEKYVLDVEFEN